MLGNFVDQFDIFLPVIALAPAAARLYGPGNLTAAVGLVFVATLVGRPIGSAIFGPVADRIGRTATTKVTMAGVAVNRDDGVDHEMRRKGDALIFTAEAVGNLLGADIVVAAVVSDGVVGEERANQFRLVADVAIVAVGVSELADGLD